jgi:hypothetical protein
LTNVFAFTRFTSRFSSRTWHSASGPGRQGLFRAGQVHTARANGLAFSDFRGYENWQVVAVSQTEDLLKVMVANPTMIDAYRAGVPGNGKPFPDGSKIAKIEWKPKKNTEAPFSVRVPDTLQDVFFIEKNTRDSRTRRDGHTPRLTMIPRRTRSSPIRPASSIAASRAIREWRPRITFSRRTARGERSSNEWTARCLPQFRLPSTRHGQPRPSGAKQKSVRGRYPAYASQLSARVRRNHCLSRRHPTDRTGQRLSAQSVVREARIPRTRSSARQARQ